MGRLVDADELKTAFPCGESVRTESVRATIDHMATVDAEPVRHGMWINISISANGNESSAECDLCGARVHNNLSSVINYCPNCGARMEV